MRALLLLGLFVFSLSAFATGNEGGGGGQGVVCRNSSGAVQSAELLDLYEMKNYYALPFEPAINGSYAQIAKRYAKIIGASMPLSWPMAKMTVSSGSTVKESYELNPSLYLEHQHPDQLADLVTMIDQDKVLVGGDTILPPAGDSHPKVLPSRRSCDIEQIAYYTDGNDRLHIVGQVWKKMNSRSQAALLVHEAIYRTLRDNGETTSDHTRKLVAFLFHGVKTRWILEDVPKSFVSCWTNDSNHSFQFVVYPESSHMVVAQFLVYDGKVTVNKTQIHFAIEPFAKALGISLSSDPGQGSSGVGIINTISDPLLDRTTYTFLNEKESDGTDVGYFALSPLGGISVNDPQNLIKCEDGLTTITVSPDGSVSESAGNWH